MQLYFAVELCECTWNSAAVVADDGMASSTIYYVL